MISSRGYNHACFVLPGHVDHGESEREAAWRETEEEAGLSKDQLREVDGFEKVLSYTAWGKPKRVVYWMAELKNPETPVKISHEHAEYRWMDLKSAVEVSKYETQRELLSDAQKYLDANS